MCERRGAGSSCPALMLICEKGSGIPRFKVNVDGNESQAVERAASILALGCSIRGDAPSNYVIWVPATGRLTDYVASRAVELLNIGRKFSTHVMVSPREEEVLRELLRHRPNKEIASRLNISVRTVKFHVSALLTKFKVQSRWELTRKAAHFLGAESLWDETGVSPSTRRAEEPSGGVASTERKGFGRGSDIGILSFPPHFHTA